MKKILRILAFLSVAGLILCMAGCETEGKDDKNGGGTNPIYGGFYNYPAGRVDVNGGRLTINNAIASEVLLFTGTVDKDNYIGTVSSLGSVKIRLPEEKFYTIIAVQKANYEERQAQAAQFNSLTYYSNIQPYTVSVSPSNTFGGGNWVFNNNTNYWVQVKKADLSQNFAVIAPNAQRVTVPIGIGEIYDYYLYFSRELKYEGKVIALVEFTDRSQSNTAQVNTANPTFTTTISNTTAPNSNIKPAVMVKNNSTKTVRVYYANTQKTNGSPGGDFVVVGGQSQLVSGFEINDDTASINFNALAWEQNKYVPASQSKQMLANKVYEITIPNSEDASQITVTEVDASNYYN
jgi:asparagine N-glycosylation enzyme membrane subunit Stt3